MFTLAHLSDIHLAPLPRVSPKQLASKRITGFINWHRKRRYIHDPAVLSRIVIDLKSASPDHIAATGDFANIGLEAEFEHAREWLGSLGGDTGVSAIPGNHDAYVAGALEAMQRIAGGFMRGDDGSCEFPFVRRRGNVALIGVSSGVPMPPFVAAGRVGEAQLAKLDQTLADLSGAFRVVLIHHPPVSDAPELKKLTDREALLRVIAARGAELVLHGHDHQHALRWLDGPDGTRVPAVGISSASSVLRPNKDSAAYNLFRIDGTAGAWSCEMETRGLIPGGAVASLKRATLSG